MEVPRWVCSWECHRGLLQLHASATPVGEGRDEAMLRSPCDAAQIIDNKCSLSLRNRAAMPSCRSAILHDSCAPRRELPGVNGAHRGQPPKTRDNVSHRRWPITLGCWRAWLEPD